MRLNTYSYAWNSPLNYRDRSGFAPSFLDYMNQALMLTKDFIQQRQEKRDQLKRRNDKENDPNLVEQGLEITKQIIPAVALQAQLEIAIDNYKFYEKENPVLLWTLMVEEVSLALEKFKAIPSTSETREQLRQIESQLNKAGQAAKQALDQVTKQRTSIGPSPVPIGNLPPMIWWRQEQHCYVCQGSGNVNTVSSKQ